MQGLHAFHQSVVAVRKKIALGGLDYFPLAHRSDLVPSRSLLNLRNAGLERNYELRVARDDHFSGDLKRGSFDIRENISRAAQEDRLGDKAVPSDRPGGKIDLNI